MTHAFFKGLLFLAAGSVIHGVGGEQDMRADEWRRNPAPQAKIADIYETGGEAQALSRGCYSLLVRRAGRSTRR